MSEQNEVGYRKPPKHAQFQKGRSGNPKGRPKGARNLDSIIRDELSALITIKEKGRTVTVTKAQAVLKAIIAKAAHGDMRAADKVLDLLMQFQQPEAAEEQDNGLPDDDEAILESFATSVAKRQGGAS